MADTASDLTSRVTTASTAFETLELESQAPTAARPSIITLFTTFHGRHTMAIRVAGALFALTLFILELWGRINDLKAE